MKAVLLAIALLSLAGCHVGSSKNSPPADHSTGSASSVDKASEKSRDAMLDKTLKAGSEHRADVPAAAASAAAPAGKNNSGNAATPTPPRSATSPKAPDNSGH